MMALWPTVTLDLNPSEDKLNDTTTGIQMGVCATLFILAIVFAAARLYVRAVMTKSFGRDDVFLIIALLFLTAGFACMGIQASNGLGRHIDLIPLDQAQTFRMAGWFMTLFVANLGMSALKTSIGLNVLRFCSDDLIWPWYKFLVWGVLGMVWIYTCIFFGASWLYCQPFAKFWDLTITSGYCLSTRNYARWGVSNSAINIVTDVLFATLPVPIIWRIKLPRRVRLYLIGVLCLGYVAVVLGIVKITYQLAFVGQRDKTYHINVPFWSFLQLATGIITSSCVALRPLLSKIVHLHSSTFYGSRNGTGVTAGLASRTGGVILGSRSGKSRKGFAEIELDENDDKRQRLDLFDFSAGVGITTSHVHKPGRSPSSPSNESSFYNHGSSDSGGEEANSWVPDGRNRSGITKTTQVSVAYAV